MQVAGPNGCESNPSHLGHVTHDETRNDHGGRKVCRIWRWKTRGDSPFFRVLRGDEYIIFHMLVYNLYI